MLVATDIINDPDTRIIIAGYTGSGVAVEGDAVGAKAVQVVNAVDDIGGIRSLTVARGSDIAGWVALAVEPNKRS